VFLVSLFLESIDLSPGGYSVCDVQEKFRSAIYEFPKVLVHDPPPPFSLFLPSTPNSLLVGKRKERKKERERERKKGPGMFLVNMIIDIVVARGRNRIATAQKMVVASMFLHVSLFYLVLVLVWNPPPFFFFREGCAPPSL
jgi:hypothetical protein